MRVGIRPESANDPAVLEMLKCKSIQLIQVLTANGIALYDDCVYLWIKQLPDGRLFPKIQIDVVYGQELEYEFNIDGDYQNVRFKAFISQQTGRLKRNDIQKEQAHPILIQIDDIVQSHIVHSNDNDETD